MKTGQAWPGAIAFAVAVSLTMGMASAQGADPAGKPETGGVPEVSADAQISRHQDGQQEHKALYGSLHDHLHPCRI